MVSSGDASGRSERGRTSLAATTEGWQDASTASTDKPTAPDPASLSSHHNASAAGVPGEHHQPTPLTERPMTAYRLSFVRCDECDYEIQIDTENLHEARSAARSAGWASSTRAGDLCPMCREAGR